MGILSYLKKIFSPVPDVSKDELEEQIRALAKLSQIFRNSPYLIAQGTGRNEEMATKLALYKYVFAYYYGTVYDYGDPNDFFDDVEGLRFLGFVVTIERDRNIMRDLLSSWPDTRKEIDSLRMEEPAEIDALQDEIDCIGKSIEFFSRK